MQFFCPQLGFIDGVGAPEMVLIFVIILVLFGGQKLPEFARGLGKTLREFKKAASGVEEEFKRALEEDERKQALQQIPEPTTPATNDPAGPGSSPDAGHDPHHDYYDHDHSYGAEGTEKSATANDPVAPAATANPESTHSSTSPAPAPAGPPPATPATPPAETPPPPAAGTPPKAP